jgi:hypothetical protein
MSDRTLTAIAIVLILAVLGVLLYRAYLMDKPVLKKPADKIQADEPKRLTSVIARSTSCSRVGGRTQIRGYVENTGNVALSMVTVQPLWKNAAGLVLDTGLVFVVDQDEPLLPGERREFEDVTQLSNISKCNVVPLDWGS